jgi:hypothetical protein
MRRKLLLALGLALGLCWVGHAAAAGGPSRGRALSVQSMSTVVLGDLPEVSPQELAQRPPTHRPRNNFTDEQWNQRSELMSGRRGSPNAAGLAPHPIGAPALRDTRSGLLTPTATRSFLGSL